MELDIEAVRKILSDELELFNECAGRHPDMYNEKAAYFRSFTSDKIREMSVDEFRAYLLRFGSFIREDDLDNALIYTDLSVFREYYAGLYDNSINEETWNGFVNNKMVSMSRASEPLYYLDNVNYIYCNSSIKRGLAAISGNVCSSSDDWNEYLRILRICKSMVNIMGDVGYERPDMTVLSKFLAFYQAKKGLFKPKKNSGGIDLSVKTAMYGSMKDMVSQFARDLDLVSRRPDNVRIQNDFRSKYEVFSRLMSDDEILDMISEDDSGLGQLRNEISSMNRSYREFKAECKITPPGRKEALSSYLDKIMSDVDPDIVLDEEQRAAVLAEDDYCLLIAGAGSGKTTTMAAKVKYLVERCNIDPKDILITSFTNKAVDELKQTVNVKMRINANVFTFHAFAFQILREDMEVTPKVESKGGKILSDILGNFVFKDSELLRKLMLFFSYYMNIPEEALKCKNLDEYHELKTKQEFETLKSGMKEYVSAIEYRCSKNKETLMGEYVNSAQEVAIANFLYLNGIDYEYEKTYPHNIPGARKLYTPDFFIKQGDNEAYLEHFGLSEDLKNDMYSDKTLETYMASIGNKRYIHGKYKTKLLETWSQYNDKRQLIDHLSELLVNNGFVLSPRNPEDVYRRMKEVGKEKYLFPFSKFMFRFIELFKTSNFKLEDFEALKGRTDNYRTLLFLDLAKEVYAQYQDILESGNKVDFNDMINLAYEDLKEKESKGIKLPYKYIIIDEFQDIAKQRFDFIRQLSKVSDAKIIAVGDDWQSIYAFAGSKLDIFTKFLDLMGGGRRMNITHTYRNSQELIDVAGAFVQKNINQIPKSLISQKHVEDPVVLRAFDDSNSYMVNLADVVTETVGDIVDEFGEQSSILIIGRYNYDAFKLANTKKFTKMDDGGGISCEKYPNANITFLTAHKSKGLSFDNVIILNLSEDQYGFPCQIEDDPIMRLLIPPESEIEYAEERRLFYVALTRTRNRAFLTVPLKRPSKFIVEMIHDGYLECPEGMNLNRAEKTRSYCPLCGFPLKYQRNKNYGLQLYICTNEPELCDFMTNDKDHPYDIKKCLDCDGYLIVKEKHSLFYGCTNYREDGKGCNHTEMII
ncbi:MAG: UvrD-helicase domain-containing protein [Methanomassiliicoccaceae archaeon]|nr:UvrD-helicase domain-containing protein [Methanomassiliicoccaceae archaeon]